MARFKKRDRARDITMSGAESPRPRQESAFPESPQVEPEARINADAEAKDRVLEAAKKIPEIFAPDQVEWVFDVYVGIISFIYSLALKVDFDAIQSELEFTKEQKESLSKPLAKILSKHAPPEWAGMTAEIQLITMVGIWTVASFQRARNVARAEEEKKRAAERTQPVAPMRREPAREIHVPA